MTTRTTEAIKREITRLRTEIAFCVGDIGGPDHQAQIKGYRHAIESLQFELTAQQEGYASAEQPASHEGLDGKDQ